MDEAQKVHCEPSTDDSPVAALYQEHAPALLNYVRRYISAREDAEDIVLGVFVAALESNVLLTRSEKERAAWLWRVAKNKMADYQRRTTRQTSAPLEEVGEMAHVDAGWTPDEAALRGEAYAELRDAVGKLPALQRQIIRMRFAQGLRCKEIAQQLNKGEGAVRMLLSRSLNYLSRVYDQQAGGDAQDE